IQTREPIDDDIDRHARTRRHRPQRMAVSDDTSKHRCESCPAASSHSACGVESLRAFKLRDEETLSVRGYCICVVLSGCVGAVHINRLEEDSRDRALDRRPAYLNFG